MHRGYKQRLERLEQSPAAEPLVINVVEDDGKGGRTLIERITVTPASRYISRCLTMNSRLRRRIAALEALEAAQRPAAPLMLPVSIVEYDEDGRPLRVVREIPAKPPAPLDLPALMAELWGKD